MQPSDHPFHPEFFRQISKNFYFALDIWHEIGYILSHVEWYGAACPLGPPERNFWDPEDHQLKEHQIKPDRARVVRGRREPA
jgi:hypothetical protein